MHQDAVSDLFRFRKIAPIVLRQLVARQRIKIATRWLNLVQRNQEKERAYTLNVSFGMMAELDPEGDIELAHVISRADCLMYKQKRNRRKVDVLRKGKEAANVVPKRA